MDHSDTPNTQSPSMAQQNSPARTNGSQLTTALIIVIVALLFVMLLLTINGQIFQSTSGSSNDVTHLKSKNSQLRAEINAERARQGLPPLPEDSSSAKAMAQRLQRDANSLATMANQWQTELEKKDELLRARENEIAGHNQNAQRLYSQINSLQTKLDQSANASEQIIQLTNDLKIAQDSITNYQQQLSEFQGRPTNEAVAQLRKQLGDSISAQNKLQLKIDQLTSEPNETVDKQKYDDLTSELAQIKPQVIDQRYEIQRLRAQVDRTKLFVNSEKDLPTEAARLFAKLRSLEDINEQQLKAAYKNIATSLGAQIVHRQTFETGSAQISFDRESIIHDIINKSGDTNAFFLVVGYASQSGGKKQNRELSSQRATTVASVVNSLKGTRQQVLAVYLGETKRFSPDNETANQICEIWEIKR